MRLKSRKKRGSALVLVMIFALFFTVISGAAVLAVSNTFKANGAEQSYESLYYAADSGIEYVTAKANIGEYDLLADEGEVTVDLPSNSFDFAIVKVKVKKTGDLTDPTLAYNPTSNPYTKKYLLAISTSTSKSNTNSKRIISSKLSNNVATYDIFKYSLCGKGVDVDAGGSFDSGSSSINSSNYEPISSGGSINMPNKDTVGFELPIYNFPKKDKIEIISADASGIFTELELSTNRQYVKKIEGFVDTTGGKSYPVYFVNTDNLIININGGQLIQFMIICSGNVTINTSSEFKIVQGSIIGKDINVARANMHFSFPPHYGDSTSGQTGFAGANSPLKDVDVQKIVNELDTWTSNIVSGDGSGSHTGYQPGDYE